MTDTERRIYAVSDLHGSFEKYMKLLTRLELRDEDMLYILGDVVDREGGGPDILEDLADRRNVKALRGNHDQSALVFLEHFGFKDRAEDSEEMLEACRLWFSDGGLPTFESFLKKNKAAKEKILRAIREMPFTAVTEAGGRRYFMSHTVPGREAFLRPEGCSKYELLTGEPDYDEIYDPELFIVTGHTPTGLIHEEYAGRIWQGCNHIALDCGAAFGYPLGCICLNTLEELYID